MMSEGSIDPKPKKKKKRGKAPVDQSNLPEGHEFFEQTEAGDPEFKSQEEREAYLMNKAENKFTPEDVASRDKIYEDMLRDGTATGDPKRDIKTATQTYIITKGGLKSEGLLEDEMAEGQSDPYTSQPLRGANKEEVRMGRKINKMTTQGSGYDYKRGMPAKGSITRRRK